MEYAASALPCTNPAAGIVRRLAIAPTIRSRSHLLFRRLERAMLRFRRMKTLQRWAAVSARFTLERHLVVRKTCRESRSALLTEW
jgi:hypothetical protein